MVARSVFFVILAGTLTAGQAGPTPSQMSALVSAIQGSHPSAQDWKQESRLPVRFDISQIGHRRIEHGLNLYSPKEEQLLGNKLARLVEQHSEVISDPSIAEYLQRLEQTISRNSDTHYAIKIKIIKDVEANAYSLPGGFIYVQSGLILAAENEAQLVAAISHEAAHIAGRHATMLVSQQRVWKWSSLLAGGPVGYFFSRKLSPLFLMRTLRKIELEADLLGLQYEYASGYDPTEFVSLIRNLSSDEEKPSLADRLSDSHPPSELRVLRAQECIRKYLPVRSEEIVDTSEFQNVKVRVTAAMNSSN